MSVTHIQQAAEKRRSIYALNKQLPVPAADVVKIIEHAVKHTPSAFNSQSTRLVVLLGAEHEKLWQLTEQALAAIVPADKFQPTKDKLASFAAGAGTVLFFEDRNVIKGLQERFPSYADTFPGSADQAGAMLQYALWTAFATQHIGANLQHYNPLIDSAVAQTWNIPANCHLRAQLVFGGIAAAPAEKALAPTAERLRVAGL